VEAVLGAEDPVLNFGMRITALLLASRDSCTYVTLLSQVSAARRGRIDRMNCWFDVDCALRADSLVFGLKFDDYDERCTDSIW
jgi:hypothetical protein